jgi:predicted RNA-binding Zn ribbon-like protein
MRLEAHAFAPGDLVGGDPALDLVNTVTGRDVEPRDWLDGYPALLAWARLTGAFAKKDLDRLAVLAAAEPAKARAALARCKRLREALCAALEALVHGRTPAADHLTRLDQARCAAADAARTAAIGGRLRAAWSVERSGLDLVTHVVTRDALALLDDDRLERLRICDGDNCGWVFVDTSKSGRRRWCDMATCGNVAKARRHYRKESG